MLTLKQKKDIYGKFLTGFEKEVDIPLATLALFIKNNNIDYEKLGYKKMKSFINDLGFFSLKTKNENGHENVFAVIHDFSVTQPILKTNRKEKKSEKQEIKEEKKTTKKLDANEKQRIFDILIKKFDYEISHPLSLVSQLLIDNNILCKDYGYNKTKSFLLAISNNIEIKEDKTKHILNVIIHLPNEKKKEAKSKTLIKRSENKVVQETKINEKEILDDIYLPDNLILSVKESTYLTYDNETINNIIVQDYKNAVLNKKTYIKDDCIIFPLSFQNKNTDSLICSIKKADGSVEYKYFINYIGPDKERPKDALKLAVYFEDYDAAIKELATLAKDEKWCFRNSKDPLLILKIYLQYTYYRLLVENKIIYDEKSLFGAFNTGLKSEEYEDIYCVILKNKNPKIEQEYIFQGFTISGSQGVGKILVEHFNPLPLSASYLRNQDDLFYDINCTLHTDEKHIILDNLSRFPISFLETMFTPFNEEKNILMSIKKSKSDFNKEKLYSRLEKLVENNTLLYTLLKTALNLTIEKAKRIVKYDYRMALPSFFPTRNTISIMLPLIFNNEKGVEAVLLVEKTPSGNYQGQTLLTLKQAYSDARLIGPLENTYFNPDKIKD